MILRVKDLTFNYPGVEMLKNISFSINPGGITVILGPNGVGKTTLLKCLNRILVPQSGDVMVNGQTLAGLGARQIARQISYVAQTNEPARVTVYDAVLMGRHPHIQYRTGKQDLKKVDAVMEQLDLTPMGLKPLYQLSGGELQKVAIARALVQDTGIMLLDEPTASLDLKNQTQILELVRHIAQSHNMAVVMTMHDLNAALRYADCFICLKDHTIYGTGEIRQICPHMLARVYGIRIEILEHRGCPIVVPVPDEQAA